jgi:hypothetical protein
MRVFANIKDVWDKIDGPRTISCAETLKCH